MIDKLSQALALVREAFADAQAGAVNVASVDLAAEVDGAQRVINAASAVQAVRVAQPGLKRDGDVHIAGDFKAAWFKDPDGNILHINNH